MAETSLDLDDLTTSDLDAALDIQTLSFGRVGDSWREEWRRRKTAAIEGRRLVGVRDGGRLVAHATLRPFRQFWGGRALPMAGMAAVVVSPDYRGRGVGTLLMRGALERAVELGDVVSALYPATVSIYRRLGWEIAGVQHRISVDAAALRRLGPGDVPLRRVDESDLDAVLAHVRRHWAATAANGPKELQADVTRYDLADPDTFCFRTDDGLLIYAWDESHDLVVRHLTTGSAASAQALWSLVGSGSSIVKTVHAHVDPNDPVYLMLLDPVSTSVQQERWMLRLLDAPAAVAGRGFPPTAELEVPITVADPLVPGCDGAWVLRIAAGSGTLTRTDAAPDGLRLGPGGLAAMYAGTALRTLRMAGLADGGRAEDDAPLDAAFAATPHMLEYF
jgi:predicted acetyltransferase